MTRNLYISFRKLPACLFLLLALAHSSLAQNGLSRVWLSVSDDDTVQTSIGQVLDVDVHLNTNGEMISGLQLFFSFPEGLFEPVPMAVSEGDTTWFEDLGPSVYSTLFSGRHQDRDLGQHMEGNLLDWGVQTAPGQGGVRPTFSFNGVILRFRLRIQGEMDYHLLGFDHNNFFFRNTLYWRNQDDTEYGFQREDPLAINVLGLQFGPLPDVYLTSASPSDSLDLYQYLGSADGIPLEEIQFWIGSLENEVCDLDTTRTEENFWLVVSDNGGPGETISIPVRSFYASTLEEATLNVLKGEPPNILDELSIENPPLVVFNEDEGLDIDLDNYVTDANTPLSQLVWSSEPVEGQVAVSIDAVSHIAHFDSGPDWFGNGQLLLRVVDPIGMSDEALVPVTVLPVNDAPTLDFGEEAVDLTMEAPLRLQLDEVAQDVDNTFASLVFRSASDTSRVALRFDLQAGEVELEVREAELFESVSFLVEVEDPEGAVSQDSLHVYVNSHPPTWIPLGEVVFLNSQNASRNLNDYLDDEDNEDSDLALSASGGTFVRVDIDPQSHVALFTAPPAFKGVESVILTATDPHGNTAQDTVQVVVLDGIEPTVGNLGPFLMLPGESLPTLSLDAHVWDVDTPDNQMSWSIEHNLIFQLIHFVEMRTFTLNAPTTPGVFDWLRFQATDPQLHTGEQWTPAVVVDTTGVPVVIPFRELRLTTFAFDSTTILLQHVYDSDNLPSEIFWTVDPHPVISATILPGEQRLVIGSGASTGRDTLRLRASDPDLHEATGFLPLVVTEGVAPVVSEFPARYVIAGREDTLRSISSYVYDEDIGDVISWSFRSQPDAAVSMSYLEGQNAARITTSAEHVGVDFVTAIASDLSANSDSAIVEIHSLENVPPGVTLGLLANNANPALLDLVALCDELLSGPPLGLLGEETLAFHDLPAPSPQAWLYRADLPLADGLQTVYVHTFDVVGNESLDSLQLASGTLGAPGESLPPLDPDWQVHWSSGEGRWTLCYEQEGLRLFGEDPARITLRVRAEPGQALQRWTAGEWRTLPGQRKEGGLRVAEAQGAGRYRLAEAELPSVFRMHPPAPNPFNPDTRLVFELPAAGSVRMEVYDILGRRVRTLLRAELGAGVHSVRWHGRNQAGRPVASGVYIARLSGPWGQRQERMLLLK